MRSSVLLAGLVVAGLVGGCAESPVAPDEVTPPAQPPMLVGEPSNFVASACIVDSTAGSDSAYVHWDLSWTAGQTAAWELAVSFTSGGTKLGYDSGSSGTSYQLAGGLTIRPGTTKNRWFWLRSGLTGGGWSNWVGLTNNPINMGGAGCFPL